MMNTRKNARGATGLRLARIMAPIAIGLLAGACVVTSPPRAYEQSTNDHAEGTLLVAEVIRDLPRSEILNRYSAADLSHAGWTEADVVDGSAVVLVNFLQMNRREIHALYALVPRSMHETLISHRHPEMRANATGNSEGGDAVAVRVVRVGSEKGRQTGLNVVESVIEPASVTGDCVYTDRGVFGPPSLYCKSLLSQGWEWSDRELVKRPRPAGK